MTRNGNDNSCHSLSIWIYPCSVLFCVCECVVIIGLAQPSLVGTWTELSYNNIIGEAIKEQEIYQISSQTGSKLYQTLGIESNCVSSERGIWHGYR